MKGSNWWGEEAPRAVMAPDNGADEGWDVDAFVQHHIVDLGFNAVHRALQGLMPSAKDRRLCQLSEELGFRVIYWMYGDVQGGTAPEDALGFGHNKNHQRAVLNFFVPYRNVNMGLGYDCGEWVNDNEGNRWYRRNKEIVPHIRYGIRARLDESRRSPDGLGTRKGYRPGDYASFEVRTIDPFSVEDLIVAAQGPVFPGKTSKNRPVINAERFRIGNREKDLKGLGPLVHYIAEYRSANVGNIYGFRDALPNWQWPADWRQAIRAANRGEEVPTSDLPDAPPSNLADINIDSIGTHTVLSWPVTAKGVTAARIRDGELHANYVPLTWPAFNVLTANRKHIGTFWIIYWHLDGYWAAYPAEHLAADNNEYRATFFALSKVPGLALRPGLIFGLFCAGPSRHADDRPEFRRRTEVAWFAYSGQEDLVYLDGSSSVPDNGEEDVNNQEGEEAMIKEIKDFQTFRISAHPGEDGQSKWNIAKNWPTAQESIRVQKVNDTDDTFVCYGIAIFIGMEASKQDEISVEPRFIPKDGNAGRLMPGKVEEKDHPTAGFDAHDFYELPIHVRINPGDIMEGKFDHTNPGTLENQTPEEANAPHASITFYCYKEK